jgi:hypothetical protein
VNAKTLCALSTFLLAAACGNGPDVPVPTCDPVGQTGCPQGLACERTVAGRNTCAPPVLVQGHVEALGTAAPIAGARVIATDANRSPVSSAAETAADGSYSIRVAATRAADGTPVAADVLLRADAAGYRTFPSGVRFAFPVSTAGAVAGTGGWIVSGPQTEIVLEPFAGAGTASIRGVAAVPGGAPGVLVVAERQVGAAVVGASALADRGGSYAIFNLPAAAYTVRAYAQGAVHAPQPATLADGQAATVNVPFSGPAQAAVTGSVQIVNPGLGDGTSIILVVASTFDAALVRGESPPGLRAPGGLVPDVKGSYQIAGVPPGDYVALAAFENDFLVRDPDLCIGGTQVQPVDVTAAAGTFAVPGFKITGALDVVSPGASGPEVVAGTPVFRWKDDSSEDSYLLTVVDSIGTEVWSTPVAGSSGADPSVTYGGPALAPGYYQFKVVSLAAGTCDVGGVATPKYLSATEDLKGVFVVE